MKSKQNNQEDTKMKDLKVYRVTTGFTEKDGDGNPSDCSNFDSFVVVAPDVEGAIREARKRGATRRYYIANVELLQTLS